MAAPFPAQPPPPPWRPLVLQEAPLQTPPPSSTERSLMMVVSTLLEDPALLTSARTSPRIAHQYVWAGRGAEQWFGCELERSKNGYLMEGPQYKPYASTDVSTNLSASSRSGSGGNKKERKLRRATTKASTRLLCFSWLLV